MDSIAGNVAYIGGLEAINEGRTLAYLQAGYGPAGLVVNAQCACPNLFDLAGCADSPGQTAYVSPTADPAPWYDPSVPESADFAGFYPTSFEGLGATYTRSRTKRISGGSVLGRRLAEERVITWKGFLFGRTTCAVQYGLRWLIARLSGVGCECDAEELDIMVCCPSATGEVESGCDAFGGASVLPSVQFANPCSGQIGGSAFDAFRTLRNVALVDGPTITSERKTGGCQGGCGFTADNPLTPTFSEEHKCTPESVIVEVEFSLVAGIPFLYGCPVPVCTKKKWPVNPTPPCPPGGTLIGVGPRQNIVIANGDVCSTACPVADTGFTDPFCPDPNLPTLTKTNLNACQECDALDPIANCCYVSNDTFGTFFEGTAIIEIYAGKKALRNTHVRFQNNPLEKPCDEINSDCYECDSLHIRYIPPQGTLVIDGLNQTVKLKIPGDQEGTNADKLIVSPFSWSTLQCIDTCVCVETDGLYIDGDNAYFSLSIIPSQM